jgi:hypothetical protein
MPLGYMVGDSGLINTETGLQLLGSHWKVRKGVEAPVSGKFGIVSGGEDSSCQKPSRVR